jgi:hypothetical protein
MNIIAAIKNGQNPEQIMLSFLENNMGKSNPMVQNIISLAKQNKTADIEKIARNFAKAKGIDFDKEFDAFRKTWGI